MPFSGSAVVSLPLAIEVGRPLPSIPLLKSERIAIDQTTNLTSFPTPAHEPRHHDLLVRYTAFRFVDSILLPFFDSLIHRPLHGVVFNAEAFGFCRGTPTSP